MLKNKHTKSIVSLVLAAVMTLSSFSPLMTVFAEDNDINVEPSATVIESTVEDISLEDIDNSTDVPAVDESSKEQIATDSEDNVENDIVESSSMEI